MSAVDLILGWLVVSGALLVVLAVVGLVGEWWRGRRAPRSATPADPCPLLGTQRAVRHAMGYHAPAPLGCHEEGTPEEIAERIATYGFSPRRSVR